MKNSFNKTLYFQDLTKATFTLYIHEGCKYTAKSFKDLGKETKVKYKNVTSWDIIEGGKEAEEIESESDGSWIDEFHEYLVIHFADGTQATFRNSHVDMFIGRR